MLASCEVNNQHLHQHLHLPRDIADWPPATCFASPLQTHGQTRSGRPPLQGTPSLPTCTPSAASYAQRTAWTRPCASSPSLPNPPRYNSHSPQTFTSPLPSALSPHLSSSCSHCGSSTRRSLGLSRAYHPLRASCQPPTHQAAAALSELAAMAGQPEPHLLQPATTQPHTTPA